MGEDVSTLLAHWGSGDHAALNKLWPLVYEELRRMASRRLRQEQPSPSLQSAALVHEAFLKLVGDNPLQVANRGHFFAIAAQVMRRILVDRARARRRLKRGGGFVVVNLDETVDVAQQKDAHVLALDEALLALSKLAPQQSQLIELRYFAGLSIEETAEALGISRATANRDWVTARAWLLREMRGGPSVQRED